MLLENDTRQIIILGYNEISYQLGKKLSKNFDVSILYYNSRISDFKKEETDIIFKKINSDLLTVFKQFNKKNNYEFIALTEGEEFNLLAGQLAKRHLARKCMVLVKSVKYQQLKIDLDLVFNPFILLLYNLLQYLDIINVISIKQIIPNEIAILEVKIRGKDNFKKGNFNNKYCKLIGFKRNNEVRYLYPKSEFLSGDILYLAVNPNNLDWLSYLQYTRKKRIFIYGGNEISLFFIKQLGEFYKLPVIIEPETEKCNRLAENLERSLILQGQGTEFELFRTENISSDYPVLALGDDDAKNLLCGYGTKTIFGGPVIAVIQNSSYQEIASILPYPQTVFYPHLIAEFLCENINKNININNNYLPNGIKLKKVSGKNINSFISRRKKSNQKESIIAHKNKQKLKFSPELDDIKSRDTLYVITFKKDVIKDEY